MGAEFILKTHIFGAFNNGRSKHVGTLFFSIPDRVYKNWIKVYDIAHNLS